MTTTIDPMIERHVREALANSLCRLAAQMPYCTDDEARLEFHSLDKSCGCKWLYEVTGVASWRALLDKAITVRAAAEGATRDSLVA